MRRHLNFSFATLAETDVIASFFGGEADLRRLAGWFMARYGAVAAFPYSSGRAALCAILRAGAIGQGHEVVLCGFTCLAVPEAVLYAGAKPVYADLAPGSWSSGVDEIDKVVTERTKAIVIQHTFGIASPVTQLAEYCKERRYLLIEDSALALASEGPKGPLGAIGAAAIFSFEMSKTVTAGWGGMAVVRDPELAGALTDLYSREPKAGFLAAAREMLQVLASVTLHRPTLFPFTCYLLIALYRFGLFRVSGRPLAERVPSGWSHRMPGPHAALVMRQLDNLDAIAVHARHIAARYRAWLASTGRQDVSGGGAKGQALLRFPMLVADAEKAIAGARAAGVELGRWFDEPVAPMPEPSSIVNYRWGTCRRAEHICRHVINLPVHPRLTERDINLITEVLDRAGVVPMVSDAP